MAEIVGRSAEAMAAYSEKKANGQQRKGRNATYPWHDLEIGQSFPVSKESIKKSSLITLAARTSKRLGKEFFVYEHKNVYEVTRVDDLKNEQIQPVRKVDFGFGKD